MRIVTEAKKGWDRQNEERGVGGRGKIGSTVEPVRLVARARVIPAAIGCVLQPTMLRRPSTAQL